MARRTATCAYETEAWIRDRLHCGLRTLLVASNYAALEESDEYSFAVEFRSLKRHGINESDLRWLISQSLVKHLIELTLPGDAERTFRNGGASLTESSCFVLTAKGDTFATELVESAARKSHDSQVPQPEPEKARPTNQPIWDHDRRELRFRGALVKRFRLPSPNQIAVLSAFDEEDWPSRIDDPLPPKPEQDPKRRLHDTIRNLNRSHCQPALRFVGDGSGQGVLWESI